MPRRTLVVPIAAPGSGKTFAISRMRADLRMTGTEPVIISPDFFLMLDGRYVWTPERIGMAWRESWRALGAALVAGEEVIIFDATNTRRMDRSALVNVARGAGYDVLALRVETPLEVCLARNAERTDDRKVPEEKLREFFRKVEEPLESEGFTNIRRVDGTK